VSRVPAEFDLKYGDITVAVSVPEGLRTTVLSPGVGANSAGSGAPLTDPLLALEDSLRNPIGSPPLCEVVRPGDRVVVLVSDITRLWIRTSDFMAPILDHLNRAGVPDSRISICVAMGSHRKMTPDEIRQIVGDMAYERVSVFQHDIDDENGFVYLGKTSRGTPVWVNRRVMEHDRILMTGGIVHHAMAGYGGGRKSVLPGIASRDTIKANHLWVLDPDKVGIRPGVGSAKTLGNPLHEDMVDAAAMVAPDFIVNVVTDSQGWFAGFFSGHWLEAWQAGCKLVDRMYCVPIDHKVDMVIASCGGYPRDISMYQASKSFYNAWMALKPGGTLVLLVEAREGGGGEEFFKWFRYPDIESCYEALKSDFTVAGYLAFLTRYIASVVRTVIVTDMDSNLVRTMGVIPAPTVREAVETGLSWAGHDPEILVMPEAGITLPILHGETP